MRIMLKFKIIDLNRSIGC